MSRRVLALAGLLLAAALLLLLLREGAPPTLPGVPGGAGTGVAPTPPAAVSDAPPELVPAAGERSAVALPESGPDLPAGADWRDGVPAFAGRVLDPGGVPAAGARVEAWGLRGWAIQVDLRDPGRRPLVAWELRTGPDGRFRTPEAPADGLRFLLRIRQPGFPPLEILDLPARPGATRDLGDLRLREGFAVAGVVLDPGGLAVPGARVRALASPAPGLASRFLRDRPQPLEGCATETDAQGRFRLPALPPGPLRIQADAPGFLASPALPVRGEPGAEVQDLVLTLEPAGVLTGLVLDPARQPVAGARLRLRLDGVPGREETSGPDGRFRLDLPPPEEGRLDLEVEAAGFLPIRRRLREADRQGPLEIVLAAQPPVRGVVLDEAGRPVPGARVVLLGRSVARDDQVHPAGLPALGGTTAGADGTFVLLPDPGVPWDARVRVAAWAEGLPLAPAWSPFLNLADPSGAAGTEGLRLVLTPGLEVRGRVLAPDGRPAAGARVHLRRLRPPGGTTRRVRTPPSRRPGVLYRATGAGADGSFRFPGLPPGDYVLEAFHPEAAPVRGQEFALLDTPRDELLQLLLPAVLEGDVVGDLDLLGPLRVTASAPERDDWDAAVDARGHFVFPNLPPDTWTLVVRELDPLTDSGLFRPGAGQGLGRLEGVELAPGQHRRVLLPLDLADRARLHGVVTVNGRPRADLALWLVPADLGAAAGDPRLRWRTLSSLVRATRSDYQGAWVFPAVDPGEYWLVAALPGQVPDGIFRPRGRRSGEVLEGPAGLARIRLQLREGAALRQDLDVLAGTLSGRAFSEGRKGREPVRGGEGRLEPGPDLPGAAIRTFAIGRHGRFRVELLPAGTWRLRLRSGGGQFVQDDLAIGPGTETTLRPVLTPMRRRDTQVAPRGGGGGLRDSRRGGERRR